MSLTEIFKNVLYYLKLTFVPEVLWLIVPLLISTIIILIYFSKYREEKPGWNSLVANSLVLIFISIALLRYIFNLNSFGATNFITFPAKTIISLILFLVGIIILFLNFKHFLPEKIAEYISSPLTLNILAYITVLFIHTGLESNKVFLSIPSNAGINIFISLLIIFIFFLILLNIVKVLLEKLFLKLKKMKDKEKLEYIKQDKTIIANKKKELKKEEKNIKKAKFQVSKVEKQVKKKTLKNLDKQKKEAIRLKKVLTKPLKKIK